MAGRATIDDRARHVGAADLHVPPRAAGQPGGLGRGGDGPAGFTLGIGPSHRAGDRGHAYGLSYDHPGRHTEEYVDDPHRAAARRGGRTSTGDEFTRARGRPLGHARASRCRCSSSALAPRLLRVAGESADGTILWMGNARAIESHVAPRSARRPRPPAAGAAHRRRPPGRRARRRRRGTRGPPASMFAIYGDAAELPADPRPSAAPRAGRRRRSSATRRRRGRAAGRPGRCRGHRRLGRDLPGG